MLSSGRYDTPFAWDVKHVTTALTAPPGIVREPDGGVRVTTAVYRLSVQPDRPYVMLEDGRGRKIAELFVLSSVHSLTGRDDTTQVGAWHVADDGPHTRVLSLHAGSSVWQGKEYRFRCGPDAVTYELTVSGSGELAEVMLFGGYNSAHPRYGSGFFASEAFFGRGFNPEPNAMGVSYFEPQATSKIDLMGTSVPGRRDWFFTPPPYCFAFQTEGGWFGIGVEAPPGANRFTEYTYHGGLGFHLSLSYEGHTQVDGSYHLPFIVFHFGEDPYDVLDRHVRSLHAARATAAPTSQGPPAWWREPIFCGWGEQCRLAAAGAGYEPGDPERLSVDAFVRTLKGAGAYSRQDVYESSLAKLESEGLSPGTITIDDKWQLTYGRNDVDIEKWPDLRGFIEGCHSRNQKVLLWLKAWDPEGITPEECITNAAGAPLSADPSNPRYTEGLRRAVHHMLSPDGLSADGFKIDFTARIPSGPGIQLHGDVWGLELLRLLLVTIYQAAKEAKPDALVVTHTPHPYLADVLDMVRLNDMADLSRLSAGVAQDTNAEMTHRARVARIACPEALIDTDNWPVTSKQNWLEYVALQPDLGVPALYFASGIDITQERLEPDDFDLLRQQWARHRRRAPEGKDPRWL